MALSPSAARRAARETALRVLYMVEVGKVPLDDALEETIAAHDLDEGGATFVRSLVGTTRERVSELDAAIKEHAIGFPPERQEIVDRNILRLSLAELEAHPNTPPGVVANEAVELAKKYSTPKAARFINGVLGALIREREKKEET